jgi:hypothetical protein
MTEDRVSNRAAARVRVNEKELSEIRAGREHATLQLWFIQNRSPFFTALINLVETYAEALGFGLEGVASRELSFPEDIQNGFTVRAASIASRRRAAQRPNSGPRESTIDTELGSVSDTGRKPWIRRSRFSHGALIPQ